MHPLQLVIQGASGRNGRRLIALGSLDPEVQLVGAIVRPTSHAVGQDAGIVAGGAAIGLAIDHHWPSTFESVIDFSSPEGCMEALDECLQHQASIVIATTGLQPTQISRIHEAAKQIPVCFAPNTSVAVNIGMKLVERAARALKHIPGGVDVEIIERHHRFKEDSPSGTAIKLGQLIASEMQIENHVHGREGLVGRRTHNEIGYHAVRVGDDVGQHTVVFGMMGETVEIRVAASNRDCYATGAIAAAKFLANQGPGLYSMADVLGLD
jgi:4-hydroxy-tetrahydrodipicolinate reductase